MNMVYYTLYICHSLVYSRHTKKRMLARKFSDNDVVGVSNGGHHVNNHVNTKSI